MDTSIHDLLADIDSIQKQNLVLGILKKKRDITFLLKLIATGLLTLFVATKGWQRFNVQRPNGHDLLLLGYLPILFYRGS